MEDPDALMHPEKSPDSTARVRLELKALACSVIPMPEDNGRRVAKIIALIFVTGWLVITASLVVDAIETTPLPPPVYLSFTALTFLLIGRLWDLEVERLLPGQ